MFFNVSLGKKKYWTADGDGRGWSGGFLAVSLLQGRPITAPPRGANADSAGCWGSGGMPAAQWVCLNRAALPLFCHYIQIDGVVKAKLFRVPTTLHSSWKCCHYCLFANNPAVSTASRKKRKRNSLGFSALNSMSNELRRPLCFIAFSVDVDNSPKQMSFCSPCGSELINVTEPESYSMGSLWVKWRKASLLNSLVSFQFYRIPLLMLICVKTLIKWMSS